MAECIQCGQEMAEADGCAEDRTVVFADGEKADPIPNGEASWDQSYRDVIEDYEQQIENGGRGNLAPDDIREELGKFKQRWDAEDFNSRVCADCGAEPGEYHHPGCDSEECPRCGEQYFICDCETNEKEGISV